MSDFVPDNGYSDIEALSDDTFFSDYESDLDTDQLQPCSRKFNVVLDYVRNWDRREAFRELFQNWRDGMAATNRLNLHDLKLDHTETKNEIRICAYAPQTTVSSNERQLLGYIVFKKKQGRLELTNFDAKLKLAHLKIGQSSKRNQSQSAGEHGEGLKLAVIIYLRDELHGHGVTITSDSFNWSFRPTRDRDVRYTLRPVKAGKKLQPIDRTTDRRLIASARDDVSVVISKPKRRSGDAISEHDFRDWMKVALDIDGPAHTIRGPHGELILDNAFAGKLYVKGLRISSEGHSGYAPRYGYNFSKAHLNRDRERVGDARGEAEILARIWAHAIEETTPQGDHEIVARYTELFLDQPESADIALADKTVSEGVAKAMWTHLNASKPGTFFYEESSTESAAVENIIKFEKAKRTQQKFFLFKKAESVSIPDTAYAQAVLKVLRACLSLDDRLANVEINVVDGRLLLLDTLFDQENNRLLIHRKWFDFHQAHELSSCEVSRLQVDGGEHVGLQAFACDHIIVVLLQSILDAAVESKLLETKDRVSLSRTAPESIRQMPRDVKVVPTENPGELRVTWKSNECGMVNELCRSQMMYTVALHDEKLCVAKQAELIKLARDIDSIGGEGGQVTCSCPVTAASGRVFEATFENLDPAITYFAMVARSVDSSFWSLPAQGTQTFSGPITEPTTTLSTPSDRSEPFSVSTEPVSQCRLSRCLATPSRSYSASEDFVMLEPGESDSESRPSSSGSILGQTPVDSRQSTLELRSSPPLSRSAHRTRSRTVYSSDRNTPVELTEDRQLDQDRPSRETITQMAERARDLLFQGKHISRMRIRVANEDTVFKGLKLIDHAEMRDENVELTLKADKVSQAGAGRVGTNGGVKRRRTGY